MRLSDRETRVVPIKLRIPLDRALKVAIVGAGVACGQGLSRLCYLRECIGGRGGGCGGEDFDGLGRGGQAVSTLAGARIAACVTASRSICGHG